jgi:hypothetical protein
MEASVSDTSIPAIFRWCTHLFLSGLKNITTIQEEGLHLIDAAWGDEDEVENRKKSQLKVESAVSNLPEGKAAEECRENVENYLVPHVVL